MPEAGISVVIPAYNAESTLVEAVDSILGQTFRDFEVIIIDDCSTDGTWRLIQSLAAKDGRVRPFRNEKNLGIAGNRNRGVGLSRGKYLAWQDADDVSLPERLQRQFSFLESHPEVGIVGGYIQLFRGAGQLGVREYPADDASLRRCIFRYSPVAQPAAMLRMVALRGVGEYDLKYPPAEDLDMTFRIGEKWKLANIPEIVVRYRESDVSATFTRLRKIELSTLAIRWKNAGSRAYRMTLFDRIYNVAHYLSIWLIPSRLKIRLFNLMRNSPAA